MATEAISNQTKVVEPASQTVKVHRRRAHSKYQPNPQQQKINELFQDPKRFLQLLERWATIPKTNRQGKENKGINVENSEGSTILLLLCKNEDKDLVLARGLRILVKSELIQRVVQAGARVIGNNYGQHPIHYVKSKASATVVGNELNVLAKTAQKQTALHAAVIENRLAVVQWLLKRYKKMPTYLLQKDAFDATALHYAKSIEVAKALIEFYPDCLDYAQPRLGYPFEQVLYRDQGAAEFLALEMLKRNPEAIFSYFTPENYSFGTLCRNNKRELIDKVLGNLPARDTVEGQRCRELLRKIAETFKNTHIAQLIEHSI